MTLLDRQLALLPRDLARDIGSATLRPDEIVETSGDHVPVNGIRREGRPYLFHSRYAALREAERIAEAAASAGCVVALGVGMGHHLHAIARRANRIVAVEPDAALLRSALSRVDLTNLLESNRLTLVTDCREEVLLAVIASAYVPGVHGALRVAELTGRVHAERERMTAVRDALGRAIERLSDDLAVQARFGLQWTRNAVLNAARTQPAALPDLRGNTVVVAAAGPSLSDAAATLATGRDPIIAVDTALPVLISSGVRPRLVVSIDCQLASYHHYLCAGFPDVPIAADLSVTPSLFSRLPRPIPLLSNHPLHRLFGHLGLGAPSVDVRGGNVAQAGVDLAVRCGARAVRLVGADFSYPDGESYPRGSYLHHLFAVCSGRLSPAQTLHFGFLASRPGLEPDARRPSRLLQPLLCGYARNMERFARSLPVPVTQEPGRGIRLRLPEHPRSRDGGGPAEQTAGPTSPGTATPPRDVLRRAAELLAPVYDRDSLLRSLDAGVPAVSLAARALLPPLIALRSRDPEAPADELVARASRWTGSLMLAAFS